MFDIEGKMYYGVCRDFYCVYNIYKIKLFLGEKRFNVDILEWWVFF